MEKINQYKVVQRKAFTIAYNKLENAFSDNAVNLEEFEIRLIIFNQKASTLEITHRNYLDYLKDNKLFEIEFDEIKKYRVKAIIIKFKAEEFLEKMKLNKTRFVVPKNRQEQPLQGCKNTKPSAPELIDDDASHPDKKQSNIDFFINEQISVNEEIVQETLDNSPKDLKIVHENCTWSIDPKESIVQQDSVSEKDDSRINKCAEKINSTAENAIPGILSVAKKKRKRKKEGTSLKKSLVNKSIEMKENKFGILNDIRIFKERELKVSDQEKFNEDIRKAVYRHFSRNVEADKHALFVKGKIDVKRNDCKNVASELKLTTGTRSEELTPFHGDVIYLSKEINTEVQEKIVKEIRKADYRHISLYIEEDKKTLFDEERKTFKYIEKREKSSQKKTIRDKRAVEVFEKQIDILKHEELELKEALTSCRYSFTNMKQKTKVFKLLDWNEMQDNSQLNDMYWKFHPP